jgi:hypothetical protein
VVVRVEGTEQFQAAAQALNEAGDREIRKAVYAAFRRAGKPLGERMVSEGSAQLPRRGGLAARIARAKAVQSNATTGRNPSVVLKLRTTQGYNLTAMDAGVLRHPVFDRPPKVRRWVQQSVPPQAFTRVFEAGADEVRKELLTELEQVARDLRNGTARGSGAALGRGGG